MLSTVSSERLSQFIFPAAPRSVPTMPQVISFQKWKKQASWASTRYTLLCVASTHVTEPGWGAGNKNYQSSDLLGERFHVNTEDSVTAEILQGNGASHTEAGAHSVNTLNMLSFFKNGVLLNRSQFWIGEASTDTVKSNTDFFQGFRITSSSWKYDSLSST